jgi:hypothetical protein
MGAAHESRKADDRERRLLRQVDPEVAAKLDEMDLERARREAQRFRRHLGMDKPKPKRKPLTPGEKALGYITLFGVMAVIAWVIDRFILG